MVLLCSVRNTKQIYYKDRNDNVHKKEENEEKGQKYHTFGTVPKSNSKIVKRGKIDTSSI